MRLNPGFDPHTHEHLATAAAGSKFGLPHEGAVALAERVAATERLAGFHVHAGSMLQDPAVAELVVRSLEPLYDRFPELELVDLGGGFAVPQPPNGQWVINLTGRCPGREATAGAVVPLGGPSGFVRERIQFLEAAATPAQIDAALNALGAGEKR